MKKICSALALLLLLLCYYLPAQSLISNGGYESGFTGWTNIAGDGGTAVFSLSTADKYEATQAEKVVVTTLGTNAWSIQTMGANWVATVSKVYSISFYAKASIDGATISVVEQNTKYASQSLALTTTWKKYEWLYTALEVNPQHKFQFPQTGTFLIDALSISAYAAPVQSTTNLLTVTPTTIYQTLEGFGGAIAFYNDWVLAHQYKEEMYQLLYDDLGLDWLRIRNSYRNEVNFTSNDLEFVQKAKHYNPATRVLMCSWSPPANLKSLGVLDSGTLIKENGNFAYGKFAAYWKNALIAYAKIGIYPDLISIQNEPDWLTTKWETCKFTPTETTDFPGYDKAFDSVYNQIKNLPNVPKMLGAEPLGIGYNNFTNFSAPIKNKVGLFGYAFHMYHGGTGGAPDSYNAALSAISNGFSDKPNFLTEFEINSDGWFKTGWLINNVLTAANSSTYLHWNLIWPGDGLINIENPWTKNAWVNAKGYSINPTYYAMKHFSKALSGGYKRIGGSCDNAVVKSSVFVNPAGNQIVTVLINTGVSAVTSSLKLDGYNITGSAVFQSQGNKYYQSLGAVSVSGQLVLPDSSITTVIYDVALVAELLELYKKNINCYPNPFNDSFKVQIDSDFYYQVFDALGKTVESGFAAKGTSIGANLLSGVYLLQIKTNSENTILKINKQ